jgi:hypothetical protein
MTQLYDAYQKAPKHIQDAVRTLLNAENEKWVFDVSDFYRDS